LRCFLRIVAGSGFAAAAGTGGIATTEFVAFVFGAAAPLMIAKLFDQVRVVDPSGSWPSAEEGAGGDGTARRPAAHQLTMA
jgi:hypothetical protein